MARVLVEICVDSAEGMAAAIAGGADRIELCAALALGGVTPSAGLMAVAAKARVPVVAMIRPRAGDFVFTPDEVAVMEADIAAARRAGLAGVVLGASLPDGRLDQPLLARLVAVAGPDMGLTLHRAFDLCPDLAGALDIAKTLGFQRILTSGGAPDAVQGLPVLQDLFARAGGDITIMPGAGITAATVPAILSALPVYELHASCGVADPPQGKVASLGFAGPTPRRTDEGAVRDLVRAVRHHS
jgi:copper homeostasis protein